MLLSSSKASENRNIEADTEWMKDEPNYSKMSNQDIQEENRKIIHTLKIIEAKLDKELEQQKKNLNLNPTAETHSNR